MPTTTPDEGSRGLEAAEILDIRIRYDPRLPVICVAGELDVSCTHLLADAVESLAAARSVAPLVALDLTGLTFCDMAGLRALTAAVRVLSAAGKDVAVCSPPPCVVRLVEVTGVGTDLLPRQAVSRPRRAPSRR